MCWDQQKVNWIFDDSGPSNLSGKVEAVMKNNFS